MTGDEFRLLLFSALSAGADLKGLLKIAREAVFDNPIMLTNSSFRTLELSTDVEVPDDVVWREAQSMGAFSPATIEAFRYDLESAKLFVERKAFLYATGLGEKIPRILAPVDHGNQALGYLIIFGVKHAIREEELSQAEILCEALRIILGRPLLQDAGMSLMDYTLKQLLDGEGEAREAISAAVTRKFFLAVSVSLPDDRKMKQYVPYLQETITGVSAYNHCFVYRGDIFLLENYDTESEHRRSREVICRLLSQYGLAAGVSNRFSDLMKLRICYDQAREARKTGAVLDPGKSIYDYRAFQIPVMLARFSREERLAMITPDYLRLKEYDEEHHTELVRTAAAWYRASMNITQTAAALHIHRNTVTYRLELIREKIGISIDRMDVLQSIVLSEIVRAGLKPDM